MDSRARELYERTFVWEGLAALARLLPCGLVGLLCGLFVSFGVVGIAEAAGAGDATVDRLWTQSAFGTALVVALLLAGLPHALSLWALYTSRGGDWWTAIRRGAREPTPFEDAALWRVLDELDAASGGRVGPLLGETRLFVLEETELTAGVVGTGLYVSAPLLGGHQFRYLAPVLAHELGHIAGGDARLQLALQRLILPEAERFKAGTHGLAAGAVRLGTLTRTPWGCLFGLYFAAIFKVIGAGRGGGGLKLTGMSWAGYWRGREFAADAFAAELGQGQALIEYLRRHRFLDAAIPYYPFVAETPYVTERIDALRWLEGERP